MKNGQKRIFRTKFNSWLVFFVLLALVVTACSPAADNPASDKEGKKGKGDSREKLTLHWFTAVDQATSVLPDAKADFVKQAIEEKFNVELNIEYLPWGEDFKNQTNVKLASGDAPDMFLTDGNRSATYAIDGILGDMTPFVSPETMPNYFKWVTETELERYAIHNSFVRAPIPFARNVYRSYYIRKDWLDKLKLDIPKNYDEMIEVMRAFTFKDPDGNGKNDTYGMSASGGGRVVSIDFPQWIHHDLIGAIMIENKEFIDVLTDLRVEKVIDDVIAMLDEGIVDPDWFLNDGSAHFDKAAQGKVGIVASGVLDGFFDSNPNSIHNKTKAIQPDAAWVPFNPFPDKPGVWTENLPGNPFVFPKAAAEERPENIKRTVEILDWLASEEGFLLTHYGVEGKQYTREGNKITLIPEAIQEDVLEQGNFLDIYDFFTPPEPEVLGLEVIDPRMTERDRKIAETINSYKLIPSIGTNVAPPDGFDLAAFRTMMHERHAQMVFDEKSGKNWSKYREELMTKYEGKQAFQSYVEQIRKVGIEIADFE
ncbi:extracellular solute-binding protein [Numidum massiliense]|uniref:extracellular solute-binding protein n=1 Tax=Numidum massiliense TaxID=1522315 RepID=UPI0006D58822|nr:extracellular solute-binding protein [Numidum massiliense]